jgi:tetratricopeptide (TPR) repeat protein
MKRFLVRWALGPLLTLALVPAAGAQSVLDEDCGRLQGETRNIGPYDYRTVDRATLMIVEPYHFTPQVERLEKGESTVLIGGDISFVLRTFPNHHRALAAMARLSAKEKTRKPAGSPYSVDCWFERAVRFTPDDAKVRVIHGYYLTKQGDNAGAVRELRAALEMGEDDGNLHYNLGLALFATKDYDGALAAARRAYELKFPLDGLRKKLQAAGKWKN